MVKSSGLVIRRSRGVLTGALCCDSHELLAELAAAARAARPPTTPPPPTYAHTDSLAHEHTDTARSPLHIPGHIAIVYVGV